MIRQLARFCLGIACTSAAAIPSYANQAATTPALSKAAEVSADQASKLENPDETSCRKQLAVAEPSCAHAKRSPTNSCPGSSASFLCFSTIAPNSANAYSNVARSLEFPLFSLPDLTEGAAGKPIPFQDSQKSTSPPVISLRSSVTSNTIEEGRRREAEGRRFLSDEDSTPSEREQPIGDGVSDPCSLRSRLQDEGIPSASCPLPSAFSDDPGLMTKDVQSQVLELWDELNHEISLQAQNQPAPPPTPPIVPPEILQPNPNDDRFLQPPPSPAPDPLEPDPPIQAPPAPELEPPAQPSPTPDSPTSPQPQTVRVQRIEVTGSTIFDAEQLDAIVRPYEGRDLTIEQLREAADKITQLYLERGYITSRAILADQVIPPEGVVQIRVIEGGLAEIRVEGTRRVNSGYVRRRVQLGAGTPLNTARLEDQLRLLRADPLFENVEASLRATGRTGQSILIVRVTEADPFDGSVGVDNYSPPSVGSERLGINLLYRNLTGNGDLISGAYYHTAQGGADNFEFVYRLPVNAMNGSLQLRTSFNRSELIDFPFDVEGDSELYEISFQQPLIRSPRQEFSLSLGFSLQENKNIVDGIPLLDYADSEGNINTSVIKFGQDYIRRDARGAWALRSLFSLGIDAFGATTNPDPIPDGRFFSWLGQVQRVQILGQNNFLIIGADVQLTPDSLLPSQQFIVGGGQSLRGYRQNIRAADNGVRFSLEDRITLERDAAGAAKFQLAPFFDAGYVWNDPGNFPVLTPRFLAGVGLGIIWEPEPGLNLRFDYAVPLVELDDDEEGENAQDKGVYFSVQYRF